MPQVGDSVRIKQARIPGGAGGRFDELLDTSVQVIRAYGGGIEVNIGDPQHPQIVFLLDREFEVVNG